MENRSLSWKFKMERNEISNRNSSNSSTWMSINSLIHHPCGLWAQRRIRPGRVDRGKEKIQSPPKLSLRTLLGLLGQSLTYMGPHTILWVWNLGMA